MFPTICNPNLNFCRMRRIAGTPGYGPEWLMWIRVTNIKFCKYARLRHFRRRALPAPGPSIPQPPICSVLISCLLIYLLLYSILYPIFWNSEIKRE